MCLYTCEICQAQFSWLSSLYNHRSVHGQNPKHACSLCGAVYNWKASLKCHLAIHAKKIKAEAKFEPVDHQDFVDNHCQNIKAEKQESSENGSGTVKLEAVVKVEEVSFDERIAAEFYNKNNVYPEKKLTEVPVMNDYEYGIQILDSTWFLGMRKLHGFV
ncbi:B-cell CLL/lymphoma 6 member B protein [Trichinella murrelli]|uniref:B-cell CLL/lymphoma 6 member B protein n=1 Tax=Trichinella murrelli TaxID=144512 RepID=A0A0V0U8K3_9BILA|nr:B-cell CLL/lymphoma 6 member B protein [Trichinella murrelli]